MKVMAINGSPRTKWNTKTLLCDALKGAEEMGAETKIVDLYKLDFKGCYSCFACKKLNSKNFGRCAYKDELKEILDEICEDTDALIIGSPIYFSRLTGVCREFLERLFFPYLDYSFTQTPPIGKEMPIGAIYTMNVPTPIESGYDMCWASERDTLKNFFGSYDELAVGDTYQFSDYTKFSSSGFNLEHKEKIRKEEFPKERERAVELGKLLVERVKSLKD